MISCFIGEDTQKARRASQHLFNRAKEENPDASITHLDDLSFDLVLATEQLNTDNLFGGQNILYFEGILDHKDGETFYRTVLHDTAHTVIIRETNPPKDLIAFFERIGTVEIFAPQKVVVKQYNNFALADRVAQRDKKMAWVEFEKVRRTGAPMEEIHGLIFWVFKTMHVVLTCSREDALASGVKEYSYRQYLGFSKNYTVEEVRQKLGALKDMYHRAHRGEGDFALLFEAFILSL